MSDEADENEVQEEMLTESCFHGRQKSGPKRVGTPILGHAPVTPFGTAKLEAYTDYGTVLGYGSSTLGGFVRRARKSVSEPEGAGGRSGL